MKTQRTIPILIENNDSLRETLDMFLRVQNLLSPICFNAGKPLCALALHKKCYNAVKGNLNSQMTCTAIRLVAGSYAYATQNNKRITKMHKFKKRRAMFLIGLRGRDASFQSDKLSIWTITGRTVINYAIPESFKKTFCDASSYDSLNVIEVGGKLQGRLCLTIEVPEPNGSCATGVDLNETNTVVAVSGDKRVFFKTGLRTKVKNRRTRKTRKRLQKKLASLKAENKNTHSVVRVLKRLGKKEHRRTLDFARVTAKELCAFAGSNSIIVFEDLKFKSQHRCDGKRRSTHRKLSAFPHALIRRFIAERAEIVGIGVAKVSPYNTSKICSKCGLIGNRSRHKFSCLHCGFTEHADINAAVNIRNRYTSLRASGLQSISPETLNVEVSSQLIAVGY